jgi:hypothetical protein
MPLILKLPYGLTYYSENFSKKLAIYSSLITPYPSLISINAYFKLTYLLLNYSFIKSFI